MNTTANSIFRFMRNYPLSLIALMTITVATLVNPETPPLLSRFDKIVHFIMYALLCSIFWYEYYRQGKTEPGKAMILLAVIIPVIFSGILELLQSQLTANRRCDIFDFLFNTLGVLFAFFLSVILKNAGISRASICRDIV